ncbi:hypothetical protein [Mycetohabitans rhizoxinica]|uniref:hypothetical protein n=1 Tax=Mycetohabitans rhizoxinica TaxID=412963 RepID=UPI0030CB856E
MTLVTGWFDAAPWRAPTSESHDGAQPARVGFMVRWTLNAGGMLNADALHGPTPIAGDEPAADA